MHAPGSEVVVERPNGRVLWGTEWPADGETPYLRFGVNNNNHEEVAVYLGFVWRLTELRSRLVIPLYSREGAERCLGRQGTEVGWQYETDPEAGSPEARDRGFAPSRRSAHWRPGLFRIHTFREWVGITVATLGDAWASVNMFAAAPHRAQAVLDTLAGRRPPSFDRLLSGDDLFVDLTIGIDLGHYDSLTIYIRQDIGSEIAALAAEYEAAVSAYEHRVPDVTTVPRMLAELEILAAGRTS